MNLSLCPNYMPLYNIHVGTVGSHRLTNVHFDSLYVTNLYVMHYAAPLVVHRRRESVLKYKETIVFNFYTFKMVWTIGLITKALRKSDNMQLKR